MTCQGCVKLEVENERLRRDLLFMADRLCAASEVLGRIAERHDSKSLSLAAKALTISHDRANLRKATEAMRRRAGRASKRNPTDN